MLTFHNDPAVKAKYLDRVMAHYEADEHGDKSLALTAEQIKEAKQWGDQRKEVGRSLREAGNELYSFAENEFEKYRIVQDKLYESDFDKHITKLLDKKKKNKK